MSLSWLNNNTDCEVSYCGWDDEPRWQVHRVSGGRNDREWTLLAEGTTVEEALAKAERRATRAAIRSLGQVEPR